MRKKLLGMAVAAFMLALSMGALTACGASTHQVIGTTEDCISCHSDSRQTYDVAPSKVTEVASTVTVSTKADKIYICKCLVAKEDGSFVVPREYNVRSAGGSSVTLELAEGTWVLSAGEESGSAQVVVSVSSSGADNITL